ncbi:MAG: class I SAM-dependent methyltransferase [Rhodobacteraceae bacterium]|nr:class I SAM-dependent methyltransferase [Paracoccaceae bacterium]
MKLTDHKAQYSNSTNLKSRANLHARYANKNWFDWVARQIDMPDGNDVLDVGCGGGWFWASAAKHYPDNLKITLVDTSEGMVTEAFGNLTRNGQYSQVVGKTADIINLPFDDGSFDTAIAMHMLYHVADPVAAIAEVKRVLRPGGLIALTTNSDDNLRELFELGAETFGGGADDPAARAFSSFTAQELLKSGFEDVRVHQFEDEYAISDVEDVFLYLTSFPPGSEATKPQLQTLNRLISKRFAKGGGVFKVRREGSLITGQARG